MSAPTPAQTLILWCLLARHGRAPQGEVVPAVKKADREALAAAGLIAVEKSGRSFVLSVTDRGWHWAGDHLDAALPPAFRVMQDWLARLGGHLEQSGRTLADFIGAPPEPAEPAETAPKKASAKKAPAKKKRFRQKSPREEKQPPEKTARSLAKAKPAPPPCAPGSRRPIWPSPAVPAPGPSGSATCGRSSPSSTAPRSMPASPASKRATRRPG